jgi:hypothetical protein
LCKNWPVREDFVPRKCNVKEAALVNPENVLLPSQHMKLQLIKNCAKAMDKRGKDFPYMCSTFSNLSHTKVKQGIFDCPKITEVMSDENFHQEIELH